MRPHLRFRLLAFIGTIVLSGARLQSQTPDALWYAVAGEASVKSFLAHADQISTIAPQVLLLDTAGGIRGTVDQRLVDKAREKGIKLIPLVMNPGFSQSLIHHVLTTPRARVNAIHNLAAECRAHHFDGIQLDLENVNVKDKAAFTAFVREAVDSLHHAHCTLSAAVVPRSSEDPGPTPWHKWIFDNWRGVYDYKALADTLDFVSYMTYAQHTGGTPPGPVAGYSWVEETLKYALSLGVSPAKLSLGIASYSDYWYPSYDTTAGARMRGRDMSYGSASTILAQRHIVPQWDDQEKVSWAMWSEAGVNEFVWMEDARAVAAKIALVKQYHLRGYSVWVLGLEDPKTWEAIRR